MTLIRRVLTSFREDEQAEAQMFQKDDGSFWLRAADGTETQVGGSGATSLSTLVIELNVPIISNVSSSTVFIPATTQDEVSAFVQPAQIITFPPSVYAPGDPIYLGAGLVYDVPAVSFGGVPLTITLDGNVLVTDLTGANSFNNEVRSTRPLPIDHSGASFSWADTGPGPNIVGTDLSWVPGADRITTSAGGVYVATFEMVIGYSP